MRRWYVAGALAALVLLLAVPMVARAAGPGDIVITTSYPWVVAEKGKTLTFNIEVNNPGQTYQNLDLQVADAPADWNPILKDAGFTIKKVIVAPGKSQMFTLQADPPATAKASDYGFAVKAMSGSAVVGNLDLKVTLADKVGTGLKLTTQLPELRGQAGGTFSFKLDTLNNATEDRSVSYVATMPEGWEAVFKPAYDTKQVAAIRVKAGETQGVDVDISPPKRVEAGDYSIKIGATAGTDRAEVALKVTVLGDYHLSISTPSGQLNAKAKVDEASKFSILVRNTGASTLQNISFSASKPDGWQGSFNPEKVESLAPDQVQEVEVTLQPGSRALAGDYMVNVGASTPQASDNKDIRVTVDSSTTWGFAGIAAIVIVLGGLGLMFARLSRR